METKMHGFHRVEMPERISKELRYWDITWGRTPEAEKRGLFNKPFEAGRYSDVLMIGLIAIRNGYADIAIEAADALIRRGYVNYAEDLAVFSEEKTGERVGAHICKSLADQGLWEWVIAIGRNAWLIETRKIAATDAWSHNNLDVVAQIMSPNVLEVHEHCARLFREKPPSIEKPSLFDRQSLVLSDIPNPTHVDYSERAKSHLKDASQDTNLNSRNLAFDRLSFVFRGIPHIPIITETSLEMNKWANENFERLKRIYVEGDDESSRAARELLNSITYLRLRWNFAYHHEFGAAEKELFEPLDAERKKRISQTGGENE